MIAEERISARLNEDADPKKEQEAPSRKERKSKSSASRRKERRSPLVKGDGDKVSQAEKSKDEKKPLLKKPEAKQSRDKADKEPSITDGVRAYYLLFSFGWAAMILSYGFGYWRMLNASGLSLSFWQILVFLSLIVVPLIAVWGPYYWLSRPAQIIEVETKTVEKNVTRAEEEYSEKFTNLMAEISGLKGMVVNLQKSQNDLNNRVQRLAVNWSAPALQRREQTRDTEPHLPLDTKADGQMVTLSEMAHVLNFADQQQKGDWANAFANVSRNGKSLEFIRISEEVLEVFEQEGIYVEDISVRIAPAEIWRDFARGERGEAVDSLAGVRDPSVLAIIRARLRNDGHFQDLALRYQKRYIEMIERMIDLATDADINALNSSRGGRMFVILGQISNVFK